jgi:hypothetical protein
MNMILWISNYDDDKFQFSLGGNRVGITREFQYKTALGAFRAAIKLAKKLGVTVTGYAGPTLPLRVVVRRIKL